MNQFTGVKDIIGQRCSVWADADVMESWAKVISHTTNTFTINPSTIYLPSNLFIPDHFRSSQRYRESERAKKPIVFETCTKKLTSPTESVWCWCCAVHISGNRFAYLVQNITDYKKLEEELKKNQEQLESTVLARTQQLQDALQVKSRFLAIMSHGK